MSLTFKHIALFGKYNSHVAASQGLAAARHALEDVAHFLARQGCEVCLEADTALHLDMGQHHALSLSDIGRQCDLGLVIGGDGTMLGVGRQLAPYKVPLIGINQGRLGFITDIPLDQYQHTLPAMLRGAFEADDRSLLHGKVWRDGDCVFDALAMNDVVVNRGATSGMVEIRVSVDGGFVSSQRSDGLIISTPTGSTAYSLSAGGPLMHPAIGGWVLAPIAPHTLSNRPIVLADRCTVNIELVGGRDASASFDMQSLAALLLGDRIEVKQSEHKVRFLHPAGWNFFDTLRKKMHWNEGGA